MLEKVFGKGAQLTVLEQLLTNQRRVTYLSGIAEATGLSHSSVARVITPLVELGIVEEERIGKQVRTFRLNEDSKVAKLLIQFYEDLRKTLPP